MPPPHFITTMHHIAKDAKRDLICKTIKFKDWGNAKRKPFKMIYSGCPVTDGNFLDGNKPKD